MLTAALRNDFIVGEYVRKDIYKSEEREVIDKAILIVGAKECLYRDDERGIVSANKFSI